jgi:hypothetical protein
LGDTVSWPTLHYKHTFHAAGARVPTLQYKLTVVSVGCQTLQYKHTFSDASFTFTGAAPICAVNPPFVFHAKPPPAFVPKTVNAPSFPSIPLTLGPSLPSTNINLSTLNQTIQNIQNTLSSLTNIQNTSNLGGQQGGSGSQTLTDFVEVRSARVTSNHRIFNPQDDTQYVDIVQIDALLFKNKQGQTIVWQR